LGGGGPISSGYALNTQSITF